MEPWQELILGLYVGEYCVLCQREFDTVAGLDGARFVEPSSSGRLVCARCYGGKKESKVSSEVEQHVTLMGLVLETRGSQSETAAMLDTLLGPQDGMSETEAVPNSMIGQLEMRLNEVRATAVNIAARMRRLVDAVGE